MNTHPHRTHIFCCRCANAEIIPAGTKQEVVRVLNDMQTNVEIVADMCELSARRDPALMRIAGLENILIIACYPRAVKWLFRAAGVPLPETGVEFLNMRKTCAAEIIRSLPTGQISREGSNEQMQVPSEKGAPKKDGDWIPWFPVIDYDRCANCLQCLSFCLFGVYATNAEGNVRVENPDKCKTNCPACARICPNEAIIFPKYSDGPINGDDIPQQGELYDTTKVDLAALVSGDVERVLRERNKTRRNRFNVEEK